ncbi:hypothetical protein BN1013_01393 [Candidatus Rubidus massiliensis]|nr:MAG: SctF chaperone SctG [Chlamydia sp. 32-24]CDZ80870.1 hypothetical protein BN1013_01393 [Candidatus Rubidus massiliensis]
MTSSTQALIEELKNDDFSLLIESGFVSVKQLDEISAINIFNAAQVLSPKHTAPQSGLGFIALNKLEVKKATDIYAQILEAEPNNHLAKAFLGICYLLAKPTRKKGEAVIAEVLEETDEESIKNLCITCSEWAKKDLNKEKAPPFFK